MKLIDQQRADFEGALEIYFVERNDILNEFSTLDNWAMKSRLLSFNWCIFNHNSLEG